MNTKIIKNDSDANENWMKTLPGYQDEIALTKRAGHKKMKLRASTGGNGNVVVRKGGSGSGHYGHAGRPGLVGGSQATHMQPPIQANMISINELDVVIHNDLKSYLDYVKEGMGEESFKNRFEHEFFLGPDGVIYSMNNPVFNGHEQIAKNIIKHNNIEIDPYKEDDELALLNRGYMRMGFVLKAREVFVEALPFRDAQLHMVQSKLLGMGYLIEKVRIENFWIGNTLHARGDLFLYNEFMVADHVVARHTEAIKLKERIRARFKGGSGSGHYGHAGRPGEVGGSLPGQGFTAAAATTMTAEEDLVRMMADTSLWTVDRDFPAGSGISVSMKVNIKGDGAALVKKPLDESSWVTDRASYSSALDPYKEADVHMLAEELGWDGIVPLATFTKDTKGVVAGDLVSVQQWVDNAKTVHSYTSNLNKERAEDIDLEKFRQVAWLDVVIGNYDRHGANLLIKNVNDVATPIAIDNGISFDIKRRDDSGSVRDYGIEMYDQVMNPDWHYGDVLQATKLSGDVAMNKYTEGKKVSRSQYNHVLSFLNSEDNFVKDHLVDRYGSEWLERAHKRVDSVRESADRRLFGYSWTD